MVEFLLEKHNPWWFDVKKISQDQSLLEFAKQPLKFFHPFLSKIPTENGVIVMRGPRRIGKTTLLKLCIKKLLTKKKIAGTQIFFYPCNRIVDFNELYDLLILFLGKSKKGKRYIFLDEVSFVGQWQRAVKDLADAGDLKNVTMILTGSNALDLKAQSERLPGRKGKFEGKDLAISPFSFKNLTVVQKKAKVSDYLLCGGFPQAINEYFEKGYISNNLYDSYLNWIEGDVEKTGKSGKIMDAVFGEIIKHLGSTVSWYIIAKNTGLGSHSTAFDYIDVFEKIFLTMTLNFYSIDQKREDLAKNKKIYFFDPIIMQAVSGRINGFTDQFFSHAKEIIHNVKLLPALVENAAAIHLKRSKGRLFYGNYQGKEVDFVLEQKGQLSYFEVKYQNQVKLSDFYFWKKDETLTVITKDVEIKKGNLNLIPLEVFLKSGQ